MLQCCVVLAAAATFPSEPAGLFASAEVVKAKECPAGQYLKDEQGRCVDCTAGTYGAVSGLSSPECSGLCEPGYYCPAASTSSRQEACPAGTYGSSYGLHDAACSGPALEGFYTTAGSTRPDQYECGTMENLFFCPSGSSLPRRVQLGYYATGVSSNTTRTGQVLCEPGHYCPDSQGIMLTCPPGSYGASYGLTDAACDGACGRGQYVNNCRLWLMFPCTDAVSRCRFPPCRYSHHH
jgi:hypothetical protein